MSFKKTYMVFCSIFLFIFSFAWAMEKEEKKEVEVNISIMEKQKINPPSLKQPLLQLLVSVYSMPQKLSKNDQSKIIESLTKLNVDIINLSGGQTKVDVPEQLNVGTYSSTIKKMKDFIISEIQKIYTGILPFSYLQIIYSDISSKLIDSQTAALICDTLSKEITNKLKDEEADAQHISTINILLSKELQKNIISINKNLLSGANAGFEAITDDGYKYFIKTFSEALGSPSSKTQKIDCRELFTYKVLEYLGFGPESYSLIQKFSSSKGSKAQGGYIVTKDVSIINFDEKTTVLKKDFFRDADICENNILEYKQAILKDENFLVELFALASLNSILRLRDTFGDNTGNYGIIKNTMVDKSVKYEPILIDHLPYTSNGFIGGEYSPGKFLKHQVEIEDNKEKKSCIKAAILAFEEKYQTPLSSKKLGLMAKVLSKVTKGKKGVSFEDAMQQAQKYVLTEINKNSNCFTQETNNMMQTISAENMLEIHVNIIKKNFEVFFKSNDEKSLK